MRDPYQVLGVERQASETDIKSAYRRLAKELHPDVNAGDTRIEERFKEVSAAYKILGDKETRARFDRGEIGPDGEPRGPFAGGFGGQGGSRAGGFEFSGASFDDIFGEFADILGGMGGRGGRAGRAGRDGRAGGAYAGGFGGARAQAGPRPGRNRTYKITVEFMDAARGALRRINLPNGRMLDVRIPAGIEDGKQIRLKGQGDPSPTGGPAGDALIEVSIRAHPVFTRKGADVHMELPISLPEAVLGGKVDVPTVDGTVSMTVAKGANSGRTLRLKGKGLASGTGEQRGDQYVTLKIVLPDQPDPELEQLVARWAKSNAYDARAELDG